MQTRAYGGIMGVTAPLLVHNGGVTLEKRNGSGLGWIFVMINYILSSLARRMTRGDVEEEEEETEREDCFETRGLTVHDGGNPGSAIRHRPAKCKRKEGEPATGPPRLQLIRPVQPDSDRDIIEKGGRDDPSKEVCPRSTVQV